MADKYGDKVYCYCMRLRNQLTSWTIFETVLYIYVISLLSIQTATEHVYNIHVHAPPFFLFYKNKCACPVSTVHFSFKKTS